MFSESAFPHLPLRLNEKAEKNSTIESEFMFLADSMVIFSFEKKREMQ